jgi:hypothetical protein
MTVAIKSVCNKTNGVEPQVRAALVRETSGKLQEILATPAPGVRTPFSYSRFLYYAAPTYP